MIAALFLINYSLGDRFNARNILRAIAFFCQSLLGLALARSIADFELLPVSRAIVWRERVSRSVILMLGIALLMMPAGLVAGGFGTKIDKQVFDKSLNSPSYCERC